MTTRAQRTRGLLENMPSLASLGSFHLSARELDELIVAHGNSGEYRRGVPCPCVRIDTRTPEINCASCKGQGLIWPPELREPMIFLDVQRRATVKLAASGRMPRGTIQVTFPSGVMPTEGDLILPDNEQHVVTELLFQEGSRRVTDAQLRQFRISSDQIKAPLVPRKERLLYPDPCCIEHVSYFRDDELVTARPADYSLDPTGRWTWAPGAGPPGGAAWVVRYRAPAAYRVWISEPIYRSEADESMPQMVTATRLDALRPGEASE